MRYLVLLLVIASFVSVVEAGCEAGQVDINSASASELEELNGIGPVYAGRIIEDRPFGSVKDLIRINGIGEKTLEKIKIRGLACVVGDVVEDDVGVWESSEELVENVEEEVIALAPLKEEIVLNGVVEDSGEVVYESKDSKILKYTPYAFSVFLIFVIVVMIFDK